ncbi:alpha-(1,3)-fucosyltransferase C-like [Macrobrachium nipponense]|uniref:alpha-(1,3)-fucosyltransferase C-like n=1 Tax=Macrobrachium nipponense TaxID=159736 RepID=UPI0030C8CDAB
MKKVTCVCALVMLTWFILSSIWQSFCNLGLPGTIRRFEDINEVPSELRSSLEAILGDTNFQRSSHNHVDKFSSQLLSEATFIITLNKTENHAASAGERRSDVPDSYGVREKSKVVGFPQWGNLTRERRMPETFKTEPETSAEFEDPSLKKILFWNDMYGKFHYSFGLGREPFVRAGCLFNKCVTTSNHSRYPFSQLDALVWHFRSEDKELPPERSQHTRYIFVMEESPVHLFGNLTPYDGVFNWTFTYRLDSDFPSPAGYVRRRRVNLPTLSEDVATGKSKMVAWFVSNCKSSSGRESLARTLQKYVPVDVYGKCGPLQCERSHQSSCYEMLERDYKFYLSFENSLCKDYVTEKFFGIIQYNVVPIVWGSADYSAQAPPHSLINAADFESVEELASYLKYLDRNTTAYMEYFKWKLSHEVISGWAASSRPWCDLCERLHTDPKEQVYEGLHDWFNSDKDCRLPTSSAIARFTHGEKRGRETET